MKPSILTSFLYFLGFQVVTAGISPLIGGLTRLPNVSPELVGTLLISELGCVACHKSDHANFSAKPPPDLSDVGSRIKLAHLQKFIATPSFAKPGTTMPDLLSYLDPTLRDETATALSHYLASLGKLAAPVKPTTEAISRGKQLYHSIGCVACHSPEQSLTNSVPLGPLSEKYTVASLTSFLKDPLSVRPGGRMPDLHLEHSEAEDISNYLLRDQTEASEAHQPDPTLASRGKALFRQYRCDACHKSDERIAAPTLPSLSQLRPDHGCLAEQQGAWPQYPFSPEQRIAVKAALTQRTKHWTPSEQLQLILSRLNCYACHSRDGMGGIPTDRDQYVTGKDENLGDQGRLPPSLNGMGAKLKAKWLDSVIANGDSVRPYMNTRMPRFGTSNTEHLTGLFKQLDFLPVVQHNRALPAEKPHEVGRELVGAKGLNCIACHTFREHSSGTIRALDLMTMAERLEEDWFQSYMKNPQVFSPLTIMPSFWPDGKSPLPEILGGDPAKQRDALWQWLSRGPDAGEPRGLVLEPLVVEVKNEAVIIRRAFPGIGKRGLGIGYPGGINLAFDANQMRLGSIWIGGFIEASGIWRGQGAGQARLLGKNPVHFPQGSAFALLNSLETPWPTLDNTNFKTSASFLGYTLDPQRRPTMRYRVEGLTIEDYFTEQRDDRGRLFLNRSLTLINQPPIGLYFRVAADKDIELGEANQYIVGKQLVIKIFATPLIRKAGEIRELLLPVGADTKLEYHLRTDNP